MSEKLQEVEFESEMGQSYVDYAMSVITDRALPDVRDGLKPVQRRVIYATSQLTRSNTPHRKCARIVGDTMGKYHPHGDSSIYEALVNMAQNWKLNVPLIDPHGNFGAEDGSGAAAMRYTEARIAEYTESVCMNDLKYFKDEFVPNFDETESEPTVLPFQVPNMLISGAKGIAVGMATNIPPHNLGEVIDATILYIENHGDVTTEDILKVMPGPDFPTGGYINASKELLLETYETGLGKLKVRGKIDIRDAGYGRKSICLTEIPYTMIGSTYQYMQTIADLCRKKEYAVLEKIDDVADRSSQDETCFAIDVKRGTTDEQIQEIIDILMKKTGLEETYGVNINCLNKGTAEVMGIKKILKLYTEFKSELYHKKYSKLLKEQQDILEVKSGLAQAVDCIDLIIEILRGSKKKADAKACLMTGDVSKITFRFQGSIEDAKQLHFTERQTDAILAMQLSQLIGLEIEALKKEITDAEKKIKEYTGLLESPKKMDARMIKDLLEIRDKYAAKRKTKIEDFGEVKLKKVEVVKQDVAVLIDRFFYIKIVDKSVFEKNIEQIQKEYRCYALMTTLDRIAIFTDENQMYMVKVTDLMKQISKKNTAKKAKTVSVGGKLSDKGIQIFECCGMSHDANILYMDSIEAMLHKTLLFIFANGKAKRVDGAEFDVTRKVSQAAKATEAIAHISAVEEGDQIVVKSNNGYYVRTDVDEISIQGKSAAGLGLIRLAKDDYVDYAATGPVGNNFCVGEDAYPFTRIKHTNRNVSGTKLRL